MFTLHGEATPIHPFRLEVETTGWAVPVRGVTTLIRVGKRFSQAIFGLLCQILKLLDPNAQCKNILDMLGDGFDLFLLVCVTSLLLTLNT